MGQPAAKQGDTIVGIDLHLVVIPSPPGTASLPHPFSGTIGGGLSGDVKIMGQAAATVDSTADNAPPHLPTPPGTAFVNAPANKATITRGSQTVKINGKAVARAGDPASTCQDPKDQETGTVVASGTVFIG
jgi:uncharacterized Zn-binding protein involved in type VI secretion